MVAFQISAKIKTIGLCDLKLFIGCLLLFYAVATVFQLFHGGDVMYEMRRRKPEPTLLPTKGIFKFPHHIGIA